MIDVVSKVYVSMSIEVVKRGVATVVMHGRRSFKFCFSMFGASFSC